MQPQQGPLQRVDETQDPFHKNNNYLSVFSHCCQLNDWIQFFPLHIDSHCVFPSLKLGCIFFLPFDFVLSLVSRFRWQDIRKCDRNRDLKCTCVVQLDLLCQCILFPSVWEENSPAGPNIPQRGWQTGKDHTLQASMWSKSSNTTQPQICESTLLVEDRL